MDYPKTSLLWKQVRSEKFIKNHHSDVHFKYVDAWDVEEKIRGIHVKITLIKYRDNSYIVKIEGRTPRHRLNPELKAYLESEFKADRFIPLQFIGHIDCPKIILYGEVIGPKIKGNHYNRDNHEFILFDVRAHARWLDRDKVRSIADALHIHMPHCYGILSEENIIALVQSKPPSALNPNIPIEGIIARGDAYDLQDDGTSMFIGQKKFKFRTQDLRFM